jgi:hypothetical protein
MATFTSKKANSSWSFSGRKWPIQLTKSSMATTRAAAICTRGFFFDVSRWRSTDAPAARLVDRYLIPRLGNLNASNITECVGGTTVCFGNEIDFRIVPFNRTVRQSSIGRFFDRPGRREVAYRHGCCLMQNKINDLNLLYD